MRLAAIVLLPLCAACAAQRELVILSEPPGALVRLDDTVVGTTPYTTTFDAYGTRRVTVYLEGYRRQSKLVDVDSPWYADFPFDVFSEVLFPFGWHDRHEVSLTLVPETGAMTLPDLDAVLMRAEGLRYAGPNGPQSARPNTPTKRAPSEPDEAAPRPTPAPKPEPIPPEPKRAASAATGTVTNGSAPAVESHHDPLRGTE